MSVVNLQRKKVVVLASSVTCMAAGFPVLTRNHPDLAMAWLGLVMAGLVLAIIEFVKLRKQQQ